MDLLWSVGWHTWYWTPIVDVLDELCSIINPLFDQIRLFALSILGEHYIDKVEVWYPPKGFTIICNHLFDKLVCQIKQDGSPIQTDKFLHNL